MASQTVHAVDSGAPSRAISWLPLLIVLLLGILIGGGASSLYFGLWAQETPDSRITMARLVLPLPLPACKALSAAGLRGARFTEVVPDRGPGPGVGALGGDYAGATLCMPRAGIVAVSIAGPDPKERIDRLKAFHDAFMTAAQTGTAKP